MVMSLALFYEISIMQIRKNILNIFILYNKIEGPKNLSIYFYFRLGNHLSECIKETLLITLSREQFM